MARRDVYQASPNPPYVCRVATEFTYHSGFSLAQKQRSSASLQESFLRTHPHERVLEVSTKSPLPLGVALSAFNLAIKTPRHHLTVECAFQGSKVFELGGPYVDLYEVDSRTAKRDPRLRSSGNVIGFRFNGRDYPTKPKDLFYNWLYVNALYRAENLREDVVAFDAFTDIEFNPARSINCQAIAAALFVGMSRGDVLGDALVDVEAFRRIAYGNDAPQAEGDGRGELTLF